MRAMTVEELRSVLAHEKAPCVSLYMPTRRGGSPEDRHIYQGHLRDARALLSKNLTNGEVDALLTPLVALDTPEFWAQQYEGLALFRTKDWLAHYRLPVRFDPLVVAADSFHVRPLLKYLQSNQRYFLLNLSQGRVSLFKGSAMGLAPIDLSGMPRALTDVLGVEPRERTVSVGSGGPKGHSPVYHGQGKDDSVRDEELARFFRVIDKSLWEVLRDETAPMVVAATERLHPLFAQVCRYPHLLHEGLRGNFSNTKLEDLHAKTWPIVQRHLAERQKDVLERYGNQISRDRATDDVSAIARHAVSGRIRELIVEEKSHLWGRMEKTTGAIELHSKQIDARDDDVIDDVAEAVILRGGEVYTFDRAKMPTKSPVAAVLRW